MEKKIKIGVADFALPVPRSGSIDANSGFAASLTSGLEIHQAIQQANKNADNNYQAEVNISQQFVGEEFTFVVSGRIDGLYQHKPCKLEEIKSSFDLNDLHKVLTENPNHPYCLQLKTYGYLFWLQNQEIPALNFCLVSSRNNKIINLPIELNIIAYENWLTLRLAELVAEVKTTEAMLKRRKKTGSNLLFPFDQPRAGQMELMAEVAQSIAAKKILLMQAPTGVGKTIGVIYPTLKHTLSHGQKAIYVTPKNSQHQVAEEAVAHLKNSGANIKLLTLTAKHKMCLKEEPICNSQYCEYAKDHYTKVYAQKVIDKLARKKLLTATVIKKTAKTYVVCPYEIQFALAKHADIVVGDYNYVFSPRASSTQIYRGAIGETGKPNLIIDEIHNLPARGMDYYSSSISVTQLEAWQVQINQLQFQQQKKLLNLLAEAKVIIQQCGVPQIKMQHKIAVPLQRFQQHSGELKALLADYLASDAIIEANNPVLKFIYYWAEFSDSLINAERPEFFVSFNPQPATIKIICCDAGAMLLENYKNYTHVIGFSATLKPFNYYRQLTGLAQRKIQTSEFLSPFPKAKRKVLIIPQLSSKFNDRSRNYPRIADAMVKIINLKVGNYFVFFASFEFLNQVLALFQTPAGFNVLLQTRHMTKAATDDIIEKLQQKNNPHILFAVQGGIFAEGVDYKDNLAVGVFIVGPPLPNYNFESEQMRWYYQSIYQNGYDYTYTYPAMAKAIQAAGRVIRSETDYGLIVLFDNRFVKPEFYQCMPSDWFAESVQELVSTSILHDIKQFWESLLLEASN